MKRYLLLLLSFCSFAVMAQTLRVDDLISRWEADFSAGLNNDGYQFGVGIAFFPVQYAGVKADIGFAGEIEEIADWCMDEWDWNNRYTVRFKFGASAVLRTPCLARWKSQDAGFYLFAEPGIILSPGAAGRKGAQVFNRSLKAGINLQLDRVIVFAGYGISDFNLYSGTPDNRQAMQSHDTYITHSVFIGTAYKF